VIIVGWQNLAFDVPADGAMMHVIFFVQSGEPEIALQNPRDSWSRRAGVTRSQRSIAVPSLEIGPEVVQ
jgi:hypothetical protein